MSTPPPQSPYGQQQPYVQHPYQQSYPQGYFGPYAQPPQAGWAVPPPLPPQRNTGRVIAVVVGAIAFFAVGGAGLLFALSGGGAGTRAEYRLSVPPSLENGKYALQQDLSQKLDSGMPVRDGYGAHDLHGSGGTYRAASGGTVDGVVVSGFYGTIDDPGTARQHFLQGMEHGANTSVAVSSKVITPTGSAESLSCEVLNTRVGVRTLPAPVCVWGDSGTVAAVMKLTGVNLTVSPDSVDLNAFADEVNTIRDEVRVKL
ncbi:DUF3824 domain-containing protein [Streptomyces silvisoli]|uniref:DUF3824 domain-containing protein n=1 Tax=Streptomyces silvisoli TaxID=3034235 RepID=A0ABT5ZID7_9ACTN|nr:DUF3824 domain-containing protein [Streptomyces silvisoli]MDF3289416.1 DUF3824 domain-containing protein [Streptomyces silvisoli]